MISFMKNKSKYITSAAIMLILMLITFYIILKDGAISGIVSTFLNANLFYVFLGLFIMLLYSSCEAANIYILIHSLGGNPNPLACLKYAYIGFYFSAITPSSTGGQPAQIYFMQKDGINLSHSTLSLMIMLMMYQFVSLLYTIFILAFKSAFIIQSLNGIWILFVYGIIINISMIGIITGLIFSPKSVDKFIAWCISLLSKIRIIKNIGKVTDSVQNFMKDYHKSATFIRSNPSIIFKVLPVSFLQVTFLYSIPYVVYLAFSYTNVNLVDVFALQSILSVSVSSLPLPGAVGASEGSFLTLFNVLSSGALLTSVMLLTRLINFYIPLVISGAVSLVSYFLSNKRSQK